ncbi:unannotated protein [freshwater metagenome]|uniref:Unannotated protein n=1 Tax=freshwater metagenome TaxID=449393 RepID=A0A6J7SJW9_9ZZZZ
MNDIGRVQIESNFLVDWQPEHRLCAHEALTLRHSGFPDILIKVVEAPTPAVAHDANTLLLVVLHGQKFALVFCGKPEKPKDHDQRDDRVQNLDRHVVFDLRRNPLALFAAISHRSEEQQSPGKRPNDPSGDPGALPEVLRDKALLCCRLRQVEEKRLICSASREDNGNSDGAKSDDGTSHTASASRLVRGGTHWSPFSPRW